MLYCNTSAVTVKNHADNRKYLGVNIVTEKHFHQTLYEMFTSMQAELFDKDCMLFNSHFVVKVFLGFNRNCDFFSFSYPAILIIYMYI